MLCLVYANFPRIDLTVLILRLGLADFCYAVPFLFLINVCILLVFLHREGVQFGYLDPCVTDWIHFLVLFLDFYNHYQTIFHH